MDGLEKNAITPEPDAPGTDAWRLAQIRKKQGATQKTLATAMGVKQPRISEIENVNLGTLTMATLQAYVAALGGTLHVTAVFGDREFALPADAGTARTVDAAENGWTIAALGRTLRDHASVTDGLREVFDFITGYDASDPGSRAHLLAEPAGADDERWDALLAATAEHLAYRDGLTPPDWTVGHHLASAWFPYDSALARCDAMVNAPGAFKARNVFLSARELEHV